MLNFFTHATINVYYTGCVTTMGRQPYLEKYSEFKSKHLCTAVCWIVLSRKNIASVVLLPVIWEVTINFVILNRTHFILLDECILVIITDHFILGLPIPKINHFRLILIFLNVSVYIDSFKIAYLLTVSQSDSHIIISYRSHIISYHHSSQSHEAFRRCNNIVLIEYTMFTTE